jgi:dienelactone hydrolase
MASNTSSKYLNFALLQLAAESLFGLGSPSVIPVGATAGTGAMDLESLREGNNRASIFTTLSANRFLQDWDVVQHKANTSTGFSGTLFQARTANTDLGIQVGDLVLSFRSTEFADDAVRDNQATNVMEIRETGFALGQIADMEKWYAELRSGNTPLIADTARLRVTGYSLGGHLATAFNLLRDEERKSSYLPVPTPLETFTFNGAGVGQTKQSKSLTEVLAAFAGVQSGGYEFKDSLVASRYQELKQKYSGRTSFPSGEESAADVAYAQPRSTPGRRSPARLRLSLRQ